MIATRLATNRLGATGLEVPRVGLGAWAIGGGGRERGWGPQDDDELIAAIRCALDQGISCIDSAAVYGWVNVDTGSRITGCGGRRSASARRRNSSLTTPDPALDAGPLHE
jgi:diketogulonate reductase-like aldo/keto reductase